MSFERFIAELGRGDPSWAMPGRGDVVAVELESHSDNLMRTGFEDSAPSTFRGEIPAALPALLPAVVIGTSTQPRADVAFADWCDVLLPAGSDDLDAILRISADSPLASTAFVQVLRGAEGRRLDDALLLESAVYSSLQAGPEFARWRSSRPLKPARTASDEPIRLRRIDETLHIELHRPHVHNALDRAMRDALIEALQLAEFDDSIRTVVLGGAGRSYCAGGDLDEFGSLADPASAHLIRTSASIGALMHRLRSRLVVHLHGACIGSGVELPAFVDDVRATLDLGVSLPELSLGLIPGAGGTWSLPRRIGRHRTAWLGLTGRTIGASTAHEWGLVDHLT